MPRLTSFATCKRIIIDQESFEPTLVAVFSALKVGTTDGKKIPDNAISPDPWAIFSMWLQNKGDAGVTFIQHTEVRDQHNNEFGKQAESFTMKTDAHTIKLNVPGVPIGSSGFLTVKIWLEDTRTGKEVDNSRYEQKIKITHA